MKLVALVALAACGDAASPPPPAPVEAPPKLVDAAPMRIDAAASTEKQAFTATFARAPFLAELRAMGASLFEARLSKFSCASCHDPKRAYGESTARTGRVAPSLRYLQGAPPFTLGGPAGGLMWDGRMTMHAQLRAAWFAPGEMAIASPHALATTLAKSPLAKQLKATYGADLFESDDQVVEAVVLALDTFTEDRAQFYPYTSAFDDALRGKATLAPAEARGRREFEQTCATCHPARGAAPIFTTFGYGHVIESRDLGLCTRADLSSHPELCGLVRIPSLRNVAIRSRFFHDGSVTSLAEAVKLSGGTDVADLVAFLKTLTDR